MSARSRDVEWDSESEATITERSPHVSAHRERAPTGMEELKRAGVSMLAGLFMLAGGGAGGVATVFAEDGVVAPTSSVTVQDLQRYDGFEDYAAQGQQMENSDVGCFANECKRETASCFTDGSCLKVSRRASSSLPPLGRAFLLKDYRRVAFFFAFRSMYVPLLSHRWLVMTGRENRTEMSIIERARRTWNSYPRTRTGLPSSHLRRFSLAGLANILAARGLLHMVCT